MTKKVDIVFVKNSGSRIHTPVKVIASGENEFSKEDWDVMAKLPKVKDEMKNKRIELVEKKPAPKVDEKKDKK